MDSGRYHPARMARRVTPPVFRPFSPRPQQAASPRSLLLLRQGSTLEPQPDSRQMLPARPRRSLPPVRPPLPRLSRQLRPARPRRSLPPVRSPLPRLSRQLRPARPRRSLPPVRSPLPRLSHQLRPARPRRSLPPVRSPLPRLSHQLRPARPRRSLPPVRSPLPRLSHQLRPARPRRSLPPVRSPLPRLSHQLRPARPRRSLPPARSQLPRLSDPRLLQWLLPNRSTRPRLSRPRLPPAWNCCRLSGRQPQPSQTPWPLPTYRHPQSLNCWNSAVAGARLAGAGAAAQTPRLACDALRMRQPVPRQLPGRRLRCRLHATRQALRHQRASVLERALAPAR